MQLKNKNVESAHHFHIPVMGLGFTIDTPLKVAKYGINSVVSIMEDHLIERMRKFHSLKWNLPYSPIDVSEEDYRAKRITAYLNMMHYLVNRQIAEMCLQKFDADTELSQYFELLPEDSDVKHLYRAMLESGDQGRMAAYRRELILLVKPGRIDVNIMTKLDKTNYMKSGEALSPEYSDAMAALRGFALSALDASIVFSAGMNPRLFSYCEVFDDFFPDCNQKIKKQIILKVSDFRSASIQGLFLAKKGLWVSEFRVESGLNCGGHAFATDGLLLGPILEEFKEKRAVLRHEMFAVCQHALLQKGRIQFKEIPELKLSAQGGVGNCNEHQFLRRRYHIDSVGWGSPFLLVPEACNLDEDSKDRIEAASADDYYLSFASPLGIPFNNLRNSSSEEQRKMRIDKKRPGSPCYKKFLSFDTEFGEMPICTASRQYQNLKIAQILSGPLKKEDQEKQIAEIEEKDCLCEGLGSPALLANGMEASHRLKAVVLCPGPNLKYFKGSFTLQEMLGHIYGRKQILHDRSRPHMFINELELYLKYIDQVNERASGALKLEGKKRKKFLENLESGIMYYLNITGELLFDYPEERDKFISSILKLKSKVQFQTAAVSEE